MEIAKAKAEKPVIGPSNARILQVSYRSTRCLQERPCRWEAQMQNGIDIFLSRVELFYFNMRSITTLVANFQTWHVIKKKKKTFQAWHYLLPLSLPPKGGKKKRLLLA